jgi:hypothetical protein
MFEVLSLFGHFQPPKLCHNSKSTRNGRTRLYIELKICTLQTQYWASTLMTYEMDFDTAVRSWLDLHAHTHVSAITD